TAVWPPGRLPDTRSRCPNRPAVSSAMPFKLPACGSRATIDGLPPGAMRMTALGDAGRIAKTVSVANPNHRPVGSDGTTAMYGSAPDGGANGCAEYAGESSDCVPSGRTR